VVGNTSGSVTLTGTAAAINAALASTTTHYLGNSNYFGADSLAVTTTDTNNGASAGPQTANITISNSTTVTETVPATLSGSENSPISLASISVADTPNTTDILTTTLSVSHGAITVDTTVSGITVVGNTSGSVTLTGTAAAINAALASTTTHYLGNSNYFGADSLAVTTTDTNNGASAGPQTANITISNSTTVTETVPATLSGSENSPISLASISVADTPNTTDILTTTLSVSHGAITVDTTVSGITVVGNTSGSVTLTGTAAAINAALASTTTHYLGNSNYFGADSLAVTTTDTNNGASAGPQTANITISNSTTVTETVPATLSGSENSPISLASISVADTPNTTDILTTTLSVSHGAITVDTTVSGITVVGNTSGSVTLTGTAAAINAALASTTTHYLGNSNYFGADSLAVTTTDTNNGASAGPQTANITISNSTTVTETVPATLSGSENSPISLASISVADTPNTTDILTTTLSVSHGAITVDTTVSGITVVGNTSGSVTLTGTAAAINAALASTTTHYLGNSNYFGADSLAVTTTDTNNGASAGPQTANITISNSTTVTETVPATLSGSENSPISLASISVADTPNTTDILTTTLSVSHGAITVDTTVSGITVVGNTSGSVTLTGTAAAINAALASTTTHYLGNSNYFGADSLAVTTTDTNNGASAGPQTANITISNSTTVTETVPATLSGSENSPISLASISVADTPNTTDILTTTLSVSHGAITVDTTVSGITVVGNTSGSVTLTGTAAAINAALASTTTHYLGNSNYFGADSLAVTTTDTNNGASAGPQTANITISNSTTVTETVPATLSGSENSPISLASISVADTPNTTDILTTTLSVSHGAITVDTTVSGITVVGNTSGSVTLTGTAAAINAALASTTTHYLGNSNYFGADSLAVTTTDTNNGASAGPQTANITISNSTTVTETVPATLSGSE